MYKSFVERDLVVKKAIAKNLDLLVATCSEEQQLPLQSIRSLIDPSFCLKINDDSLQLSIPDISRYIQGNEMWYSPPFYIGDVQSGMKVHLAVHVGVELGMQNAFRTYVKLEILESELQNQRRIHVIQPWL